MRGFQRGPSDTENQFQTEIPLKAPQVNTHRQVHSLWRLLSGGPWLCYNELPLYHSQGSSQQTAMHRISILVQHRAIGHITHFHEIYGRFWYLRWSSII